MKIGSVWIIGGGKVGKRSVASFRRKMPDCRLTVFDTDTDACEQLKSEGVDAVCTDGISFLAKSLNASSQPEWIIPAIPRHVAYLWIRYKLAQAGIRTVLIPIPDTVVQKLPNPMAGEKGVLYSSCANFICPENCPEPEEYCTVTRKPRPCILHETLARLSGKEFLSIAIQSHQLMPGLGGYPPQSLNDALESIRKNPGRKFLLSTACKCHGVLNYFRQK